MSDEARHPKGCICTACEAERDRDVMRHQYHGAGAEWVRHQREVESERAKLREARELAGTLRRLADGCDDEAEHAGTSVSAAVKSGRASGLRAAADAIVAALATDAPKEVPMPRCESLHPTAPPTQEGPLRCYHGEGHEGRHGNGAWTWTDAPKEAAPAVAYFNDAMAGMDRRGEVERVAKWAAGPNPTRESVERNASEVATWPQWKRDGSGLLPVDPRDTRIAALEEALREAGATYRVGDGPGVKIAKCATCCHRVETCDGKRVAPEAIGFCAGGVARRALAGNNERGSADGG